MRMVVIVLLVLALLALIYVAAQIVSRLAAHGIWYDTPPTSAQPAAPSANRAPPAISLPSSTYPASARPKGSPAAYFGADNYPPEALRRGEQGRVQVSLSIDGEGHVDGCRVTNSSGSQALDEETCAMGRRIPFEPARAADGTMIPARYPLGVRWVLPQD